MGAPFMWILKKKYDYWWKNTDLKRLTRRLKLRFLTEIGRLHWNQDEEVAHFAWFGEPCKESSSPHPAIVPIEGAVLFELKRLGLATISLKVDHICIISIKFGGNWIITYFFWQQFSIFCNSDGHIGWQPEVFNQNIERRPHMHSFHMVWLHLTLYRILK